MSKPDGSVSKTSNGRTFVESRRKGAPSEVVSSKPEKAPKAESSGGSKEKPNDPPKAKPKDGENVSDSAKKGDVSKVINLGHPSNTQIFGAPGSGKSHLIKYLVYERFKRKTFKRIYVFAATAFTHEYDWVEEDYIISSNFDKAVDYILDLQKDNVPCLVIFDDITGSINWNHMRYNKLFTEYRKRNMSIILAIHYANNYENKQ